MSNDNTIISLSNFIDSTFIYYMFNEYNLSMDGITEQHIEIFNIILQKSANRNENTINHITPSIFQDLKEIFINSLEYSKLLTLHEQVKNSNNKPILKDALNNITTNLITRILENKGIHHLPIGLNATSPENPNQTRGHAVAFIIHTIIPKYQYDVYFMNSGFGTEFHKSIVNYTIKNEAILKYSVNYITMKYCLHFITMCSEIYQ